MGKVVVFIRRFMMVSACLVCIGLTCFNADNIDLTTHGTIYIVDEYADTYYEMLSDNVGLTTINGISNVYVNMLNSGYNVYNEDIESSYIDVSFVKDNEPSYRYYFTYPECRITFFCSDYENSYTGLSYIIERKE